MIFRTNKTLILIFVSSLIVYLLSCAGLFDGLSKIVAKSLYNALGYTNEWSHSYGPSWFVGIIRDISSLGSKEIVLLFSLFLYYYLKMTHGKTAANNFVFTISFGIVLIFATKTITSKHEVLNLSSIYTESLSYFPSGHAFIATVMYLAMAQCLSSRKKSNEVNRYLFITASILILLVGISLFSGSGHTVTEVIAGWSLGLCWFSFAQMFLKINYKTFFNK